MRLVPILIVLTACGSHPAAPSADPTQPEGVGNEAPGDVAPPNASASSTTYTVHEWGLVDVGPDGSIEVAAGPGHPEPEGGGGGLVRKPVLYFHREGSEPITVAVRARIPRGAIYEHWPAGAVHGDTVSWSSVRLDDAHCPPIVPVAREATGTRAPDEGDGRRSMARPRCATPDSVCEVRELGRYVTSDATCLEVGGARARLLFYRGLVASASFPLAFAEERDGRLAVLGAQQASRDVGELFWYRRISPTESRVARGTAPAAGATSFVDPPTARVDFVAESNALAELVRRRGLTDSEARVFADAWAPALFGAEAIDTDAVVYVLPAASVAAVAELEFVPPPRAIRRILLVRVARRSVR